MLDTDLALLYDVSTKVLNQAVKRNIQRFPKNFMFQLGEGEFEILRSQIVTSSLRSQSVTLENLQGKHRKYLPFAFTEQGVSMLSGVLRSKTAVDVSIQIINSFVTMRKFIGSNVELFQKLGHIEKKIFQFDEKFEQVFDAIGDKSLIKKQGIFFDGQIFDAYAFISKLIKSASKSIVLIDNYVDESVLVLLSKRNRKVSCNIYTENIKDQLKLDLEKHNLQYPAITLHKFKASHDRFLIIDEKEVYHIGASLKDVGKRWFAFSKINSEVLNIIEKLE